MQPISIRQNNPGNMRGKGGAFQKFATPEEGLRAMRNDLMLKVMGNSPAMKARYGEGYQPTLRNLISTWAPSSENNTDNYIGVVSKQTGIHPDDVLTPDSLNALIPAMTQMEGGKAAADYFGKGTEYADAGNVTSDAVPVNKPDKLKLYLEAEKRGILPPEKAPLLAEARKRGLIPQLEQATPEEPGLLDRIGDHIQKRGDESRAAIADYEAGNQSLLPTILDVMGKAGAGTIGDVLGEGVQSLYNSKPAQANPLIAANKLATEVLANTEVGRGVVTAAKYVGDQYKGIAKEHPQTARHVESAVNLLSLLPMGKGAQVATNEAITPVLSEAGSGLMRAGEKMAAAGNAKSIAQQVGADNIAGWSREAYARAHAVGGEIPAEAFNKALDKAASVLPKSEQAKAAFGKGATASFIDNLADFRGKSISFDAAEELDKGLGSQITQAYRVGNNEEASRLIGAQQALREAVDTLPEAASEVKTAKALWSASANQRRVESILERAQYTEQPATAIRTGFRQLAKEVSKNPRGWSAQEIQAIKGAAKTGIATDILKIAGSRLVPMLASTAGPLSAVAGYAGSTASRSAAEVLQSTRANKVSKAILSRPAVSNAVKAAGARGELLPQKNMQGLVGALLKGSGKALGGGRSVPAAISGVQKLPAPKPILALPAPDKVSPLPMTDFEIRRAQKLAKTRKPRAGESTIRVKGTPDQLPMKLLPAPDKVFLSDWAGKARAQTSAERIIADEARQRSIDLGLTPDVRKVQDALRRDAAWNAIEAADKERIGKEIEAAWQQNKMSVAEMVLRAKKQAAAVARLSGKKEKTTAMTRALEKAIKDAQTKR